jgi:tetratricopeptide (TPR) repeat protein
MSKSPERPRRFLPAVLIVAATLLAYAPVLRAGFIWDDDAFLTENPLIHAPDGLCRFWFTAASPDYFPLTSSMLWVEWRLWGPNATGYHLVNVLLHAASAVLLWRVLLRLRVPGAWLAGLLFAVHPVAVESVAWITERKNTLAMALYMASILAYLHAEAAPGATETMNANPRSAFRSPHYFLSLGLFLLALLAKTSVVMLPVVLLGCAWWRRGRVAGRDLLRLLPFAAVAAALGLVTVWYQYHNAIGAHVVRSEGLAARAAGAGWAAWFYLYKALLPLNLCFVYPRWTPSVSLLAFVPGFLFLAMLLLFARFRQSPSAVSAGPNGWGRPFLFALGYFLVSLLPVLGFVNISFMYYSLVADRWQYTALVGVVALAAGLLAWSMERPSGTRTAAMASACALVLACGGLTFRQTHIYHDQETLWRDTVAKNPSAWIAYTNLGGLLFRKAMAPGADSAALLDEAGRYCEEALRILDQAGAPKPYYAAAYVNRGNIRAAAKRYDEAIGDYTQAIAFKPDDIVAYYNRGNVCIAAKRYAEAIGDYTRAVEINLGYTGAYLKRAAAYYAMKDYPRALSDVRAAQRLGGRPNPDFLRALDEAAGGSNTPLFPTP